MIRYEYKVVAAPTKGIKGKGVRGAEARFSFALQELMNGLAGYGWEYQRAETLPSVERSGIAGSTTEWRNVLVFRRPKTGDASEFQPELLPAPQAQQDEPPLSDPAKGKDAPATIVADNGVENTDAAPTVGASLSILARARNLAPSAKQGSDEGDQKDDSASKD